MKGRIWPRIGLESDSNLTRRHSSALTPALQCRSNQTMRSLKRALAGFLLVGCGLSCSPWRASAAPVIYEASGPTRESIAPVIEQFKHDIVYGPGGDAQDPPLVLGSFKVATFDDIAAGSTESLRAVGRRSGGLDFITYVGLNMPYVSAESGARLFSDINPNYASWLQSYSGSSVMGIHPYPASGKPVIVHDPSWTASPTAFGAVFVDVDFGGVAGFKFWADFPYATGPVFDVTPSPGDGNFTFLGVILDSPADPDRASPGVFLRLPDLLFDASLTTEDSAHDIAAVDDVIMGVAAVPEPSTLMLLVIASFLSGCAGVQWRKAGLRHGTPA